MVRKLKALGLALVAVLAMSAVVASAANAGSLYNTNGTYPVTLHGEQEAEKTHVFTLTDNSNLTTTCTTATFAGTLSGTSSTATIHPTYGKATGAGNCTAFGLSAEITTTGCDYVFHIGNTITSGVYDGTVDIVCSGTNKIIIVAGSCEVQVGSQNGLATVTGNNVAGSNPDDVTITAEVEGIDYTVTKDGFLCPLSGTGNFTEGDYTGATTVKGSVEGKQIPLALEH